MTDTATLAPDERTLIVRHRLSIDGLGAPLIGGGFFVVMMTVTAVASTRAEVTISAWEVGSHVVRWFIGAMGVYLTAIYLPLYVAYGRTRRDTGRQLAVFGVLYAGITGLVMAAGFLLERGIYRLAGWSQGLESSHFFATPAQVHLVAIEHALLFAVWLFAGGLLGAAFYRRGALGVALLPVGLAAVWGIEVAIGSGHSGLLPPALFEVAGQPFGEAAPLLASLGALATTAALAAATWPIVRDLPLGDEPS